MRRCVESAPADPVDSTTVDSATVHASGAEVTERAPAQARTCARVSGVRVPSAPFERSVPLDEASVRAWTEAHAEEIDRAVAQNAMRYTELEAERRASHILIAVAADADAATVRAARARAQAALARARRGEDFVALARELSEDPGSAGRGGDLGWSPRGRYVAEVDEALFAATRPGLLRQLLRTQFGFHVISVTGVFVGGEMPAADVRADLARDLYLAASSLEPLRAMIERVRPNVHTATELVRALEAELPQPHAAITTARLAPFEEGDLFEPDLEGRLTSTTLLGLAPGQLSAPMAAPGGALVFVGEGPEPLPEGRARCFEPSEADAEVFMRLFVSQQPPESVEDDSAGAIEK
ncbi:MAG: peptidylprolyl isomerase [Sandaracinus sp.]